MIRLPAIPFGYGLRFGITRVLEEQAQLSPLTIEQGCALTIPFQLEIEEFTRAAKTPGVEFLIIPTCSPYSHFAANIWSIDTPTMAVEQPWHLIDGVSVLADFDSGQLLVSESESDDKELRKLVRKDATDHGQRAANAKTSGVSRSAVRVLAEVASASDILRALADGADGLGVVRADQLFHEVSGDNSEAQELIRAVKSNPQVLPLLVRFFDSDQDITDDHGRIHVPHRKLGYRGARILEVDDTWFQRFVAGLEMLDLEQIVVVLPMVTLVSEVQRIRRRLAPKWDRLGVTVETPAAALRINELLEISDFIEIGLNDLTQYTMAWDRDVPNWERLPSDRIVEPVADLIASVAAAAATARVPYTLGMDLRPSKSLAAQVLGLGITSISCAPSLIKPWKNAIASHLSSIS